MKLKAKDNLAPIRNQIGELTEQNSTVIEFGCGNGELLLNLSSKINFGLGIDKSKFQIKEAVAKQTKKGITNIEFVCRNLDKDYLPNKTYDTAIASLFFHTIPIVDSIYLINKMRELANNIVICGFCKPETARQKALLWIDQKITSHYKHFKAYKKFGYLIEILAESSISNFETYDTNIPFLKIYKID